MNGRTWLLLALVLSSIVVADDIRRSIINHCRDQMGDYGSAIVKACVDQDIAAHAALQGYDGRYSEIIERCTRQMLSVGGWAVVRACTDQDIEAERALEDY